MPIISSPDVVVHNHGSIVVIQPCSDAAKDWVEEHIGNDAQWWGGGFVCEPRYVDDILCGMAEEGLLIA